MLVDAAPSTQVLHARRGPNLLSDDEEMVAKRRDESTTPINLMGAKIAWNTSRGVEHGKNNGLYSCKP
jgi:hypothetical protein